MQSFPLLIIIIIDNQQKRKMQERHIDRKRYFEEQAQTSEKYYLPYVKGKGTIEELLSIKKTRCTIEMFRTVARQAGYQIVDQQLYLVNPHYEIKFGLSPRKLWKVIASIPYIRNFFSTSCFYVLRKASL